MKKKIKNENNVRKKQTPNGAHAARVCFKEMGRVGAEGRSTTDSQSLPTLEKGLQDGHVDVLVLLGANVKHGDLF